MSEEHFIIIFRAYKKKGKVNKSCTRTKNILIGGSNNFDEKIV